VAGGNRERGAPVRPRPPCLCTPWPCWPHHVRRAPPRGWPPSAHAPATWRHKLVRRGGQARGPKGWREGEEESGGPLACAMGISAHLPLSALVELALGRGVEGRSGRRWRVHRRMPNPQRRHGRSAARAQHRLCTVAQHAPATCPELAHALADTRRRGARTRRLGRLLRHLPY
jgi:hypothetical protein